MTMTLNDAVAALKAHARQLEAVQVIASAIQDVAAIDQLTDEAEQRRVARQLEVDAAHARLVEVENRAKSAQESALAASAKANAILEDAKLKAVSIVEQAKSDALAVTEKATAAAMADLKKVTADVEAGKRETASLLAASDDLTGSINAKRAELAEIEDKIAKARALLAGFMG